MGDDKGEWKCSERRSVRGGTDLRKEKKVEKREVRGREIEEMEERRGRTKKRKKERR